MNLPETRGTEGREGEPSKHADQNKPALELVYKITCCVDLQRLVNYPSLC